MRAGSQAGIAMAEESGLVLPFAVIEQEGAPAQEFPLEMTLATVLADVEKTREKAGVLRKREEALEFVSMLYWPLIVVPWRETRHIVFDGMGVWSYVFAQGKIPDARSFAGAVDAAKDWKSLLGLLNDRAAYFDQFGSVERVPIMGLFIHEEFLRDVLAHVALAKSKPLGGSPILASRLSIEHAQKAVHAMQGVIDLMAKDIEGLGVAGRSLEGALGRARNELAVLRDETVRQYGRKIDALRPEVAEQVARLERERDEQWAAMQPKLIDLQSQVRKLEADVAAWDAESRRRDDLSVAARAREQRDRTRYDLDRARGETGRYEKEMADSRAEFDRRVQVQWDRIRGLERERDAEVARLNQQEQAIVALVAKLSLGVSNLVKQLQDGIRFLESQGVPANISEPTRVRMPILVASFTGDRGRRLVVYPPMVAKAGKGVLGGIRSTFGGAVLPLEPKTQQFEEIFRSGIEKALAEDASLAAYLASVGNANNLLHLGNLRSLLSRGLAAMKAQGWIKDKHERELLIALERHIATAARNAPRRGP